VVSNSTVTATSVASAVPTDPVAVVGDAPVAPAAKTKAGRPVGDVVKDVFVRALRLY
jgi:hypothetical protein